MLKLLIVGSVLAVASANFQSPIREDLVEEIRKSTSAWRAHSVDDNPLRNYSTDHLLGLLGTANVVNNDPDNYVRPNVGEVPSNFDARDQWGKWVHDIRDQAQCGSCWAFGSTEALSDRFAIASKGSIDVVLSPQDMVSCDTIDYGCSGGYLYFAWYYLTNTGAVPDTCDTYKSQQGVAPTCSKNCDDGTSKSGHRYKCTKGSTVNPKKAADIEAEIYANGPVEGGFTVYEDFYNYKDGVYYHVSGAQLGGHAIKIIGFGEESGMRYWLAANSWGESWGIKGYFKIKQGDSGINDQVYACTPDLTSPKAFF